MLQQNGNAQATVAGPEVAAEVPGDDAQKKATTAPPHQSFFDDLRLRDCLIVLGLLLVLVALVDRELHDKEFAKFLADRPLLSASIFTALLSFMAYGGWNAVRAHWEAEKWRKLSSLAMVSMAYDITVVIDTCIWLVVGVKPFSSFTPSDAAHDKLTAIRTDKKCPLITDQDYGKIKFEAHSSSLVSLTDHPGWLNLANLEVERAKVDHRRRIALWVPSMMLHPTATEVLGRVVALNDFLSTIQDNLRTAPEKRKEQTHKELVDLWTWFLAEAMSLREDLWAASRGRKEEWLSNRGLLPENIRTEMGLRDKKLVRDVVALPFFVPAGKPLQPKASSKLREIFRRRPATPEPLTPPAREERVLARKGR